MTVYFKTNACPDTPLTRLRADLPNGTPSPFTRGLQAMLSPAAASPATAILVKASEAAIVAAQQARDAQAAAILADREATQRRISALEDELNTSQRQNDLFARSMDTLRAESDSLAQTRDGLLLEQDAKAKALSALQEQLDGEKASLAALAQTHVEVVASHERRHLELDDQLAALQRQYQDKETELRASTQEEARLTEALASLASEKQTAVGEVNRAADDLRAERAQLETRLRERADEVQTLSATIDARQRDIADLRATLKKRESQLADAMARVALQTQKLGAEREKVAQLKKALEAATQALSDGSARVVAGVAQLAREQAEKPATVTEVRAEVSSDMPTDETFAAVSIPSKPTMPPLVPGLVQSAFEQSQYIVTLRKHEGNFNKIKQVEGKALGYLRAHLLSVVCAVLAKLANNRIWTGGRLVSDAAENFDPLMGDNAPTYREGLNHCEALLNLPVDGGGDKLTQAFDWVMATHYRPADARASDS